MTLVFRSRTMALHDKDGKFVGMKAGQPLGDAHMFLIGSAAKVRNLELGCAFNPMKVTDRIMVIDSCGTCGVTPPSKHVYPKEDLEWTQLPPLFDRPMPDPGVGGPRPPDPEAGPDCPPATLPSPAPVPTPPPTPEPTVEAPAEPVTAPPAAVGDGFGTTEGLFVGTASASSGRKLSAVSCTSAAARDCARKCPAGPAGKDCESCAPYELSQSFPAGPAGHL